jgi:cell division septum initiation protein DivIVA
MDILYLVDRLENLVSNSKRMPLVNQIILKEADLLAIIEQMRSSIPGEIKQARRIIQEKDRLLAQAQSDASMMLARSKEETERVMTREGLLKVAEERSQDMLRRATDQAQGIVRRAETHTEQMQIEADSYASETLRNLREHLLNVEMEIERTVMSIERGLDSLDGRPDDETPDNLSALDEEDEDDQTPHSRSLPRRASLAADTMGGPNYPA